MTEQKKRIQVKALLIAGLVMRISKDSFLEQICPQSYGTVEKLLDNIISTMNETTVTVIDNE